MRTGLLMSAESDGRKSQLCVRVPCNSRCQVILTALRRRWDAFKMFELRLPPRRWGWLAGEPRLLSRDVLRMYDGAAATGCPDGLSAQAAPVNDGSPRGRRRHDVSTSSGTACAKRTNKKLFLVNVATLNSVLRWPLSLWCWLIRFSGENKNCLFQVFLHKGAIMV